MPTSSQFTGIEKWFLMCFFCILYQMLEAVLGEWLYRYRQLALENRLKQKLFESQFKGQSACSNDSLAFGDAADEPPEVRSTHSWLRSNGTNQPRSTSYRRRFDQSNLSPGSFRASNVVNAATLWYTGVGSAINRVGSMSGNQALQPGPPFLPINGRRLPPNNWPRTGSNHNLSEPVVADSSVESNELPVLFEKPELYTVYLDRISRFVYPMAVISFSIYYWPQMCQPA
jgi:hypothetical protein